MEPTPSRSIMKWIFQQRNMAIGRICNVKYKATALCILHTHTYFDMDYQEIHSSERGLNMLPHDFKMKSFRLLSEQ